MRDRWLKSSPFMDRFFPADRSCPCYGFYSPAIDRLVFVDSKDLFLSLHAAVLFSSKVLLLVVVFEPPSEPLDNSNCYLWAPEDRVSQSAFHIPQLFPNVKIPTNDFGKLEYRGASHVPEQNIFEIQEHLGFIIQATYALYITEALDSANAPQMYEKFFPEFRPFENSDRRAFRRVEQVLYQFESIFQAMTEIDQILSERLEVFRHRRYYARFNRLLYGKTKPSFRTLNPVPPSDAPVLYH